MLVIKVYSNNIFLGYLDKEKSDITRHISNARIFDDEEIDEVKNITKRFSDCEVVKWEVKETELKIKRNLNMKNENIYDGCGVISSELLKKNFEGFKQGKIVNLNEGIFIPFDIKKYMNETKNIEVK